MNFGENISKLLLLVIIAIVLFIANTLDGINKNTKKFYAYDKGKINLQQVKKIHPRVEYYATLSQDKNLDLYKKYSTHFDIDEIDNINSFLATTHNSKFYNIEITAFLLFDNERVNIYRSKRYLKLPSNYTVSDYMLNILKMYGVDDYQYAQLEKLKGQLLASKKEFTAKIVSVAKLNNNDWVVKNVPILGLGEKAAKFLKEIDQEAQENLLSDDEIKTLIEDLKSAYSKYTEIK